MGRAEGFLFEHVDHVRFLSQKLSSGECHAITCGSEDEIHVLQLERTAENVAIVSRRLADSEGLRHAGQLRALVAHRDLDGGTLGAGGGEG